MKSIDSSNRHAGSLLPNPATRACKEDRIHECGSRYNIAVKAIVLYLLILIPTSVAEDLQAPHGEV